MDGPGPHFLLASSLNGDTRCIAAVRTGCPQSAF